MFKPVSNLQNKLFPTFYFAGNYVQVIGEVIETGHHPVIRSMKIQDLSEQSSAPNLWMPEIEHMKHILSQHYSSGIVILQG